MIFTLWRRKWARTAFDTSFAWGCPQPSVDADRRPQMPVIALAVIALAVIAWRRPQLQCALSLPQLSWRWP